MNKVRLGIIGVGNIGTTHLKNIMARKCPEIEITAVADIDPARLDNARALVDKARAEHPEIPEIATFADAMDMISSGQIDAVLVAVPHYDHPRYSIAALKAGLHVMSEKPAGVYAEQVREVIAEADQHPDLYYALMFNLRKNSIYAKMHEIMQSGELGAIRRTNWVVTNWYRPQAYYDSGSWRATWSGEGGGVLLNQCPHNLDLWQWICGMPCKVSANLHYGKWHDIEVEDDATVYVEYPNGATGVFVTSTGDTPGTNRFEIVCDGGTLICDGTSLILKKLDMPEPEFSKTNTIPFGNPKVETINIDCGPDTGVGHPETLNAFAAAILRGEPLSADGREGINGLTLSNAMHLSSWLGKPIELPMDDALFKEELMKRVKTSRRKVNVSSVLADTDSSYNVEK